MKSLSILKSKFQGQNFWGAGRGIVGVSYMLLQAIIAVEKLRNDFFLKKILKSTIMTILEKLEELNGNLPTLELPEERQNTEVSSNESHSTINFTEDDNPCYV